VIETISTRGSDSLISWSGRAAGPGGKSRTGIYLRRKVVWCGLIGKIFIRIKNSEAELPWQLAICPQCFTYEPYIWQRVNYMMLPGDCSKSPYFFGTLWSSCACLLAGRFHEFLWGLKMERFQRIHHEMFFYLSKTGHLVKWADVEKWELSKRWSNKIVKAYDAP
jgi:hypothetical protein